MLHRPNLARVRRLGAANLVVCACAASAGAHAGLVPEHLREEPRVGVAFAFAVALLVATGTAVALRPSDPRRAQVAAVLLSGLAAAYIASRTTGIPLLAPDPEAVDAIGITTVSVELLGAALAMWLGQPIRRRRRPVFQEVIR
jgi:hypothetical protein